MISLRGQDPSGSDPFFSCNKAARAEKHSSHARLAASGSWHDSSSRSCSGPRATALAADAQWIAAFGRATESQETDIVRLAYRHPLPNSEAWWRPTHVQLGGSLWQVPDIRGSTRRFDLNATAIWRSERPWGYLEAGFGGYLLSKTINNPDDASALGVRVRLAYRHRLFSSEKPRGRSRAAAPFERRPQAAERRHRPGARSVHFRASRLIRRPGGFMNSPNGLTSTFHQSAGAVLLSCGEHNPQGDQSETACNFRRARHHGRARFFRRPGADRAWRSRPPSRRFAISGRSAVRPARYDLRRRRADSRHREEERPALRPCASC